MGKVRESQFELLRIVAQWMIVFYHLIFFFTASLQTDYPFLKGIQIPFHIGVILFVLISGYYGIKPSLRGGIKLVSIVAVYYIPISLIAHFNNDVSLLGGGGNSIIENILFISHSPYWYIRTYLFLYLLSPMINKYLEGITHTKRVYLLVSLLFISMWCGTTMGDNSLSDGKNVVNFIFIYTLGNTIRMYKNGIVRCPTSLLLLIYVVLNILLVVLFSAHSSDRIGKILYYLSYPYCSPIIIANALMVFIVFSRIKYTSNVVNKIASGVLAVYLLHSHPVLLGQYISVCAERIVETYSDKPLLIITLFVIYTSVIYVVCTLIHFFMRPIWYAIDRFADRISNVLQSYFR